MNVEELLKKIICELADFNTSNVEFNEDLDLTENLGFTSIDLVKLIVKIEEQFDIVMDDAFLEVDIMKNYKKLCDSIYKMVEECK